MPDAFLVRFALAPGPPPRFRPPSCRFADRRFAQVYDTMAVEDLERYKREKADYVRMQQSHCELRLTHSVGRCHPPAHDTARRAQT